MQDVDGIIPMTVTTYLRTFRVCKITVFLWDYEGLSRPPKRIAAQDNEVRNILAKLAKISAHPLHRL